MADSEISRSLPNGSSTSKAMGAAAGGHPPAREAAPTTSPMAPHRCTLQFLLAVIKNSQRGSPLQQNE